MKCYEHTTLCLRMSKFSSMGYIYSITIADIDRYFKMEEYLISRHCEKHKAILSQLHELLAYKHLAELPDDMISSAKERYPKASAKRINSIVSSSLRDKLARLQRELDGHKYWNECFAFIDTEKYCLDWFNLRNTLYTSDCRSMKDLRKLFAKYERDYLVDYFISKAAEVRASVFEPCVERMVCSSNAHYQKTIDSIQRKRLERKAEETASGSTDTVSEKA